MSKIVGIIQCRMGSSTGKAIKNIAGIPLLKFLLKNLKGTSLSKIVVATSYKKIRNSRYLNISIYKGSEKNVLSK